MQAQRKKNAKRKMKNSTKLKPFASVKCILMITQRSFTILLENRAKTKKMVYPFQWSRARARLNHPLFLLLRPFVFTFQTIRHHLYLVRSFEIDHPKSNTHTPKSNLIMPILDRYTMYAMLKIPISNILRTPFPKSNGVFSFFFLQWDN